jgi:alkanesulfonate monooxygenase SsuD/methylene tetrahydromethanopterin reductase-like flavin-dependent oxidoreductase (luciferase family)
MKFGNFLFPDCRDPARDGVVIDETLREALLADELGIDVIWLAEHHFDGICAYVDPIIFAGALATTTRHAKIGFAVVQTALHHPIRLAEQLAILDNITRGRLVVGLGRGSSYNIYDYQGFGIDHHEAQARLEEAEDILVTAWTQENFEHHGRFWDLDVPMLRPRPYTKPHPPLIRAASGEASLVALARQGRPFLMNVQAMAATRHRIALYRKTMCEAGFDEAAITRNLEECWVWRNVFVAETDAEAERVGVPAFQAMVESRAALRNRIYRENRPADRGAGGGSAVRPRQHRARLHPRVTGAGRRGDCRNRHSRHRRRYRDLPPRPAAARGDDQQPHSVHATSGATVSVRCGPVTSRVTAGLDFFVCGRA